MKYFGILLVAALVFFSFRYQEIRFQAHQRLKAAPEVDSSDDNPSEEGTSDSMPTDDEDQNSILTAGPAEDNTHINGTLDTLSIAELNGSARIFSDSPPDQPTESALPPQPRDLQAGTTHSGMPESGIRQRGQLHSQMLTPANFEYLGAFRPPHTDTNGRTFAYGGWGIGWRPPAPGTNSPGSLFIVGHQSEQLVAEITIPTPVISATRSMDELPVATVLQNLGDISNGLLQALTDDPSQPFEIGGLYVTDDRLHWTMYRYYNVDGNDFYSHATSSLNIADPDVEGPWHIGPQNSGRPEWHAHKFAGYIFDVPEPKAKKWFEGRRLISGLQTSTGLGTSSSGPAMISYQLPPRGTPSGVVQDAVPLMWFDTGRPAKNFHPADRWTGAAWLTAGNKQSVIVVGRKALGEVFYGSARPTDCMPDKGYHGDRYEARIQFYSPASLIHSAYGQLQPFSIEPWYEWGADDSGGGFNQYLFPTCHQYIGGTTVDHERNLLYVSQTLAGTTSDQEYEILPVIHVFRIVE
ncbi:MAG: hypothetical protein KDA96_16280 [Planctomycetaceae bacterium]|nr:hypothetical protein [Planctomycetaceae bacterium]